MDNWVACLLFGGLGLWLLIAIIFIISEVRAKKEKQDMIKIFSKLYPAWKYIPDKGMSENYYCGMNFLYSGNTFKSMDHIDGVTDNGTAFEYCEVDVKNINYVRSKLTSRPIVERIWKGGILSISLNKEIHGHIVIIPKSWRRNGNFVFNNFKRDFFDCAKKIETDNVKFNKKFVVYTEDYEEAFYILTPKVLEGIMNLYKFYKKGPIINVQNDVFNVAIPKQNLLEPSGMLINKLKMKLSEEKLIKEAANKINYTIEQLA